MNKKLSDIELQEGKQYRFKNPYSPFHERIVWISNEELFFADTGRSFLMSIPLRQLLEGEFEEL
jgi:hypothetical protein